MAKMNISKSIHINAKPEKVFPIISDFEHWSAWSPWLIMEENVKVDVEKDGKAYSWEGDRVGSGNMKVTAEKTNEVVECDLNFLKPWKSYAKVDLKLKEVNEGTEVTWTMDSSLPFFMFFMKKMMVAFVGMDYERGLRLLKDYVEDGEVHSKLNFKGNQMYHGCDYVGIKRSCSIDEMGKSMREDFTKLQQYFEDNNTEKGGNPLSIYHKWDMVNRKASYTAAIPCKSAPEKLANNMINGNIPKIAVHSIEHTGTYEHLGNAWSAQYSMQRSKTFKMNKKIDPFEVYKNDPSEVDAKELITEINFATK